MDGPRDSEPPHHPDRAYAIGFLEDQADLPPETIRRDSVEGSFLERRDEAVARRRRESEAEPGRVAHGAQDPRRIVEEGMRMQDANEPAAQVVAASQGIDEAA